MGTAKFLITSKAAKIVAECGSDNLMSMATCFVHAAGKRFTAIVMCPPQLPSSPIDNEIEVSCRIVGISDVAQVAAENGVIGNFAFWGRTALELAGNGTIRNYSLSKVPKESDS